MKVKVNRSLRAGSYRVSFVVSDFTSDEVSKMSSFGVPAVRLKSHINGDNQNRFVGLTNVVANLEAVFGTEELAQAYEKEILAQISGAISRLRASKDTFSSVMEVEL